MPLPGGAVSSLVVGGFMVGELPVLMSNNAWRCPNVVRSLGCSVFSYTSVIQRETTRSCATSRGNYLIIRNLHRCSRFNLLAHAHCGAAAPTLHEGSFFLLLLFIAKYKFDNHKSVQEQNRNLLIKKSRKSERLINNNLHSSWGPVR